MSARAQRRLLCGCALLVGAGLVGLLWRALAKREPGGQDKTVMEWARQAGSHEPGVRTEAIAALRALEPASTRVLIAALSRRESFAERAYLTNEARLPRPLKRELSRVFQPYQAAGQRVVAARALGALGASASNAVPVLVQALDDPGPGVAAAASLALGQMGSAAVHALTAACATARAPARPWIFSTLAQIGADAAPAAPELARQLEMAEAADVPLITFALARIGAPAVPVLLERLTNAAPRLRELAARALGGVGHNAHEAVEPLLTTLGDEHAAVRAAAAQSLSRIRPTALPVIEGALEAAKDPDATVRQAALAILGAACRFAPRHRARLVPALIEALHDETATNRAQAAALLALVQPPATNVLAALTERLRDADTGVRDAARAALEELAASRATTN